MFDNELQLFVLNSSRAFGEQVARWLDMAPGAHEERDFEDGEHRARPLDSVRGNDVFVLQSLYGDARQSANDKLCRLLFFIGALKDGGAARVTAVLPYLAYARNDRRGNPGEPVTTRYVAALFEAVGTDAVLALDVHNLAAYQNAFRCCTEHLEASRLFVKYFAPLLRGREVVVVSPDAGSIKRAEQFRLSLAQVLDKPVSGAIVEKHRVSGVVSGEMLVGEVKGREAIIVDDMISTGNTLARSVRACRAAGAGRVYAAATHGLFAGDAQTLLADGALERIVVSDSVPAFRLEPGAVKAKLTVLSCSALFAEAIECLHGGVPRGDLLMS
ncbi:ribose-phosphate diphosphokinase [Janthinobacterium fluminis]|uniref:ribose-phosphate diphosphokinase n=1 Tax=Janthinobacterium fluminis TaxID=2987524 RepID=A0ABT5K069_9BURK|nr:ribose-phosphate pyrophosphokinase [Janthinobacterium fluminis]MDC8758299.1 ribose-phosphate pyrophosphokinase [Janthinobacterium fluminis]